MKETLDVALLLEVLARERDPLSRFVDQLPDDAPMRLRSWARETRRMREELQSQFIEMLNATDMHEALSYAAWISAHVQDIAYRWVALRRACHRWCELQATPAIVMRTPGLDSVGDIKAEGRREKAPE